MTGYKELIDKIRYESDEFKKAELQKQLDDMHRLAEEEKLLDDENFIDFEVK